MVDLLQRLKDPSVDLFEVLRTLEKQQAAEAELAGRRAAAASAVALPTRFVSGLQVVDEYAMATGNPPPSVPVTPEGVEALRSAIDAFRLAAAVEQAPATARLLAAAEHAAWLRQDAERLAAYERIMRDPTAWDKAEALVKGVGEGFVGVFGSTAKGMAEARALGGRAQLAAVRQVLDETVQALESGTPREEVIKQLRRPRLLMLTDPVALEVYGETVARVERGEPLGDLFERLQKAAADETRVSEQWLYRIGDTLQREAARVFAPPPGTEASVWRDLGAAFGSFGAFATTGLLTRGFFGRTGGQLSMYGVATATGIDEAYQRALAAGLSPNEALDKALQGAPAGFIQALSVEFALRRLLPPPASRRVLQLAADIAATAGGEAIVETLGAIMQNMVERTYNPERDLFEGTLYQGLVAGSAAALFRSLFYAVIPGARRSLYRDIERAEVSADMQRTMELLSAGVSGEELRKKAPPRFRAWAEAAATGTPAEMVYVSPEGVTALAQTAGGISRAMELLAAVDPSLTAEAVREALAEGRDISIPMAAWLSSVVGSGLDTALMPYIRLNQEQMTAAERARLTPELEAELADIQARAAAEARGEAVERPVTPAERLRAEVYETVRQQLVGAGQTESVAAATAAQYAAAYGRLAERSTLSPEEFLRRFPPVAVRAEAGGTAVGMPETVAEAMAEMVRHARSGAPLSPVGRKLVELIRRLGGDPRTISLDELRDLLASAATRGVVARGAAPGSVEAGRELTAEDLERMPVDALVEALATTPEGPSEAAAPVDVERGPLPQDGALAQAAEVAGEFTTLPDRPQLPVRVRDGLAPLYHWSHLRLKVIDPARAGTGPLRGAERFRGGPSKSFFGLNVDDPRIGYRPERGLGPYMHVVAVDPRKLYPWYEDPDSIKASKLYPWRDEIAATKQRPPVTTEELVAKYEELIKEAGYLGYYITNDGQGSAPLGTVAALFYPVPVEGAGDVDTGQVLYQSTGDKWYYSALARAVVAMRQAVAPASQWKGAIKNLPGVKADELKWTGILEYLDARGKDKVTKAELLDYLETNGLQVKALIRTEPSYALDPAELSDAEVVERRVPPQYEQYTVPVKNYTEYGEVLIVSPELANTGLNVFLPRASVEHIKTHFGDVNPLSHLRYTVRTAPDEERVFFIEEVQSDFGTQLAEAAKFDPAAAIVGPGAAAAATEIRLSAVASQPTAEPPHQVLYPKVTKRAKTVVNLIKQLIGWELPWEIRDELKKLAFSDFDEYYFAYWMDWLKTQPKADQFIDRLWRAFVVLGADPGAAGAPVRLFANVLTSSTGRLANKARFDAVLSEYYSSSDEQKARLEQNHKALYDALDSYLKAADAYAKAIPLAELFKSWDDVVYGIGRDLDDHYNRLQQQVDLADKLDLVFQDEQKAALLAHAVREVMQADAQYAAAIDRFVSTFAKLPIRLQKELKEKKLDPENLLQILRSDELMRRVTDAENLFVNQMPALASTVKKTRARLASSYRWLIAADEVFVELMAARSADFGNPETTAIGEGPTTRDFPELATAIVNKDTPFFKTRDVYIARLSRAFNVPVEALARAATAHGDLKPENSAYERASKVAAAVVDAFHMLDAELPSVASLLASAPTWLYAGVASPADLLEWARLPEADAEQRIATAAGGYAVVADELRDRVAAIRAQLPDASASGTTAVADYIAAVRAAEQLVTASPTSSVESDVASGLMRNVPVSPLDRSGLQLLAVKWALHHAIRQGYDWLAWTPAYVQEQRWDMAVQNIIRRVWWGAPTPATSAELATELQAAREKLRQRALKKALKEIFDIDEVNEHVHLKLAEYLPAGLLYAYFNGNKEAAGRAALAVIKYYINRIIDDGERSVFYSAVGTLPEHIGYRVVVTSLHASAVDLLVEEVPLNFAQELEHHYWRTELRRINNMVGRNTTIWYDEYDLKDAYADLLDEHLARAIGAHRIVHLDIGAQDRSTGRTITLLVDRNGIVTGLGASEPPTDAQNTVQQLLGTRLSATIGDALTARVLDEEKGEANATDVKFGASGYETVYDRLIKKFVDDFAKKYGARVEKIEDLFTPEEKSRTEDTTLFMQLPPVERVRLVREDFSDYLRFAGGRLSERVEQFISKVYDAIIAGGDTLAADDWTQQVASWLSVELADLVVTDDYVLSLEDAEVSGDRAQTADALQLQELKERALDDFGFAARNADIKRLSRAAGRVYAKADKGVQALIRNAVADVLGSSDEISAVFGRGVRSIREDNALVFSSVVTALDELRREAEEQDTDAENDFVPDWVWGVRITPEMREAARKGFPLFQPGMQRKIRGQIVLPPRQGERAVITLFSQANLSTLLHEMGHHYLWIMEQLVKSGEAKPDLATDWQTIGQWWADNADTVAEDASRIGPAVTADDVRTYLVTGSTGRGDADRAIWTALQELWARGTEAYLREGRAPSNALRRAFHAFRAWLMAIYRSLDELRVRISPEIRTVFDRLFATEAELEEARGRENLGRLSEKLAEQLGLPPEKWRRLKELEDEALREQETVAVYEVLSEIHTEVDEQRREREEALRKAALAELRQRPEYRALAILGDLRDPSDPNAPAAVPPEQRLDRRELIERYGPDVLRALPRGRRAIYTAKGVQGMPLDAAAEMLGFRSGDELVQTLLRTPPLFRAVEARVADQLTASTPPDPVLQPEMEEAAKRALHGEATGRLLAAEVAAIAEAAQIKEPPLTRQMAREIVRRRFEDMRVVDAERAALYLAAERRAAREAFDALEAGKLAEAYEAKRKQLINFAAYAEAVKIKDTTRKLERLARRLQKKSTREKLAPEYLAAIDELLDKYEFRKTSRSQLDAMAALQALIERMRAEGRENELIIAPEVAARLEKIHYRQITVAEMRGLYDALRNLDHVARWAQRIRIGEETRQFDEVVDEILAAFDANVPIEPRERVPRPKPLAGLRSYFNLVRTASTILRRIDGQATLGPAYKYFKAAVDAGARRETIMRRELGEKLDKLYSVYSRAEMREMSRRMMRKGWHEPLSKWDLIAIALNLGNADNIQRLTDPKARGFTMDQIQQLMAELDDRDWDFVQGMWDLIDSYWGAIAERERRVTGVPPKKVEPTPYTTPSGRVLRGGYYPIVYDGELSAQVTDERDAEIMMNMLPGQFGRAQTARGHLIERKAGSGGRVLLLDVAVAHRHLGRVIHDLALGEAVAATWRLLRNPRIRAAFQARGMLDELATLELWIQDVAVGQIHAADMLSRLAAQAKANFTLASLGFNMLTLIMQPTGLVQSSVALGHKVFLRGLWSYLKRPHSAVREVVSKSSLMQTRQTTFNKDINDILDSINRGAIESGYSRIMRKYMAPAAFLAMQKFQFYTVDVPTWIAAYGQALREGLDERDAVAAADAAVVRAQAGGEWSDRTAFERGTLSRTTRQSAVVRLFTALASYMIAKLNVGEERVRRGVQEMRTAGFGPRALGAAFALATDLIILFALEAVLISLALGRLPGLQEDDDDDDDRYLKLLQFVVKEGLLAAAAGLPVVRDLAGPLQGFSPGGAYGSIVDVLTQPVVRVLRDIEQEELHRGTVTAIVRAIGLATGLPTTQTNRLISAAWRTSEGEDVSPSEWIFGARR